MEQNYMNASTIRSYGLCETATKKTCAPVCCSGATQRIPCKKTRARERDTNVQITSCGKRGRCLYPSLRLDLLPTFKYIGLEGRCAALMIWRVRYWRELLLQLASAAGGRARGGCSSVSCRAQLRKIGLQCGVFCRDLSGCSSRYV